MEWLKELFVGQSVAQALMILALVAGSGVLLGSFKIKGIGLGIAGVLFTGLLFGHFGFKINHEVLEFVREFGLVLFVYTIGMQVGPGFVASLRKQGLPLNLMAGAIVLLGALITVGIVIFGGVNMSVAVGLFAGGTTNTPALGAAQQALKNLPSVTEEMSQMPGLGYAVAYPFGVLGIILAMGVIRGMFRVSLSRETSEFTRRTQSSALPLGNLNLEVTNPELDGLPVAQIPGLAPSGVVLSRLLRGGKIAVVTPETALRLGDVLHAVGAPEKLQQIQTVIGKPSGVDLRAVPDSVTTRHVVVTRKSALGKRLAELNLDALGVTVTRISRSDIEFTPPANFRLRFADTLLLVGEADAISRVAEELGNSPKHLNHPQIVPVFAGIALGVLAGSIPFQFPHIPAPVKLGLAGGPLLVAILLSRIGRIGPLIYYMPISANFMLRELGITLFLACVGLKAGDQFVQTITQGDGLYWMGLAAIITLVPLLVVGVIARVVYKLNYVSICGVLAGSMTDPPALAFANTMAGSDAPSISYATVYPLTMLLRVLTAQLLVLLFLG